MTSSATCEGRTCVLIDDMIDTGGTIVAAAEQLKEHGRRGGARGMHPRRALGPGHRPHQELGALAGDRDQHGARCRRRSSSSKIEVLSVAGVLADAIDAVFEDTSVSEIFGGHNQA